MTRYFCLSVLFVSIGASHDCSAQEDAGPPAKPLHVAVLLFDGVELLDFAGPSEVFIVAGHGQWFEVHTVAETKSPIQTMGGIKITPSHTFDDKPKADIIVIPGGGMSNVSAKGIEWIRSAAKEARVVMSVCMGAFLLARADLLDDIEATTHHWGIDGLKRAAPKCRVVSNRRFVDAGRIITTAGVTAGIDGALHVVERLFGKDGARWTAEEWMEYRRDGAKSDSSS